MVKRKQSISPDELLIHPGETILEVIQDRNITQKELAIRTGFTEKHISTVINGKKSISAEFAKKLEYALNIPASFWRNLQTNYDLEIVEFNEIHNITDEEKQIAKEIMPTVEALGNVNLKNKSNAVYKIRELLGVSNLKAISTLNPAQYRGQFAVNTSENIMYAWQYLCEKKVEGQTNNKLDIEKLKQNLNKLKNVMHEDEKKHMSLIKDILNESGILFTVEKQVEHAPINGLTVKTKKGQVMIALTIRGRYIDIFWFTLFHEIAHVIYQDYLNNSTNINNESKVENRANEFAANILINNNRYKEFIENNDFSMVSIREFAKENKILPTIIIGRLMKEEYISWKKSYLREKYN